MATPFKQLADNALSVITTDLTTAGATSSSVNLGDGLKFPTPGNGFYATLWSGLPTSDPRLDANREIIVVTARVADALTHTATTKIHAAPVNIGILDASINLQDMQAAINAAEVITATVAGKVFKTGDTMTGVLTATGIGSTGAIISNVITIRPNSGIGTSASLFLDNTLGQIFEFYCDSSGAFGVYNKTAGAPVLDIAGNGNMTAYGNVISTANNTYALGSTAKYWANLYATRLNLNSTAYFDGSAAGIITTLGSLRLAADPTVALGAATKQYVDGLATASGLISSEVPTGAVNGANTAFTTASSFATNSLRVYRNGIRLKGSGVDFTAGASSFTMVTAPLTGDLLLVDYNVNAAGFSVGTNSTISSETPAGLVNSANAVYTAARAYIAGSVEVYIDGIHQTRTTDYTETTPASGIFTMTTAPITGQTITVNYQFNLNPSSNSDTVDGIHANATAAANQLMALDANAKFSVTLLTNPCKFSVYRAAALSSAVGVGQVVAHDTKLYDTGNNVDIVTNKGRFTATIPGFYIFGAAAGNTAATATIMYSYLQKNGVTAKVGQVFTPATANNICVVFGQIQLAIGDYVEHVFVGGGGSVMSVTQANCYFDGFLFSQT